MIDETGCDAVMIGRAALSNPFIFREVDHYFKTGELLPKVPDTEKIDLAIKHLNYLLEFKNEKVAVLEMRTIAANYIKGIPGSTKIKQSIFMCKTKEELIKILEEYRKTL
jgi:tRNA-dihydrouridine synthase B